jgi:hypothetical protein
MTCPHIIVPLPKLDFSEKILEFLPLEPEIYIPINHVAALDYIFSGSFSISTSALQIAV